jgi:hypothetical protein
MSDVTGVLQAIGHGDPKSGECCCPSFMRSFAGWRRASWRMKIRGRRCRQPRWCMRRGCGWRRHHHQRCPQSPRRAERNHDQYLCPIGSANDPRRSQPGADRRTISRFASLDYASGNPNQRQRNRANRHFSQRQHLLPSAHRCLICDMCSSSFLPSAQRQISTPFPEVLSASPRRKPCRKHHFHSQTSSASPRPFLFMPSRKSCPTAGPLHRSAMRDSSTPSRAK